jgi:predicted CopG family antitoxin
MHASLQIDDDVYEEAQRLAASENRSLGEVLSDLARRALRTEVLKRKEGGFPRFSVPEDTPPITLEMVKTAESDS